MPVKVISLDLRTALMDGEGVFAQEGFKGQGPGKEEEIDYCTVLNRSVWSIWTIFCFSFFENIDLGIFHLKFVSLDGPQRQGWITLPGAKWLKLKLFRLSTAAVFLKF